MVKHEFSGDGLIFLSITAKVLSVKGNDISRSPQVPRFC